MKSNIKKLLSWSSIILTILAFSFVYYRLGKFGQIWKVIMFIYFNFVLPITFFCFILFASSKLYNQGIKGWNWNGIRIILIYSFLLQIILLDLSLIYLMIFGLQK